MLFVIITTICFFKYIGIQSVQMLPGSQSAVTKTMLEDWRWACVPAKCTTRLSSISNSLLNLILHFFAFLFYNKLIFWMRHTHIQSTFTEDGLILAYISLSFVGLYYSLAKNAWAAFWHERYGIMVGICKILPQFTVYIKH